MNKEQLEESIRKSGIIKGNIVELVVEIDPSNKRSFVGHVVHIGRYGKDGYVVRSEVFPRRFKGINKEYGIEIASRGDKFDNHRYTYTYRMFFYKDILSVNKFEKSTKKK